MDVSRSARGAGAVKTLSTLEVVNLGLRRSSEPENAEPAGDDPFSNSEVVIVYLSSPASCLYGLQGMEHLWSRAVATSGNRWQMGRP